MARALLDFLHCPLFFFLAFAVHRIIWKAWKAIPGRFAVLCAALFLSSGLTELLQIPAGREASLLDWLESGAGLLLALIAQLMLQDGRKKLSLALLWVVIGIAAIARPLLLMNDLLQAHLDFPLLAAFESKRELVRWSPIGCRLLISSEQATHGNSCGRIVFENDTISYPGIFLEFFQPNWSKATALAADAFWRGPEERIIVVRIDDLPGNPPYNGRFQAEFPLHPGWNPLRIPLENMITPVGHLLRLEHIDKVGLFLEKAKPGEEILLDHVRLELK